MIWWLSTFVFFKQKTAYEMRMSDWSSDLCSSDLRVMIVAEQANNDVDATLTALGEPIPIDDSQRQRVKRDIDRHRKFVPVVVAENLSWEDFAKKIGRASCRERVCQYV